jgi:hypothetical protein
MENICRWCKYFEHGVCKNEKAFEFDDDIDLSAFWEDGALAAAVDEGFSDCDFRSLEGGMRMYGISQKRIDILLQLAQKDLDGKTRDWKSDIAANVEKALDNYNFDAGGVTIADPHTFVCKEFI